MIFKFMKNNKRNVKKTVLVIDDDQVWMNEVKHYLELSDFKVIFLKIPEEKKSLHPVLKNRKIDVVVSEVKMTGLDGFSVARNIREKFGGKFKIVLTAKTLGNNLKAKALAFKADSLISKTPDLNELSMEINRVLRFSG